VLKRPPTFSSSRTIPITVSENRMAKSAGLVISIDGSIGFQYREEGAPRVVDKAHEINYVLFRDDPTGLGHIVIVQIPFDLPKLARNARLQLPVRDDSTEVENILVQCALGELVDRVGDVIEKQYDKVVPCDSDLLEALSNRERASESVARHYIKAKTWWAYKLNQTFALFYHADRLRLGTPTPALQRLAEEREDQFWEFDGERHGDGFMLRATRALRKFDPREREPSVLGGLIDVRPMLKAPRYAAPAAHLERSFDAAKSQKDPIEAAREAIHALEALAKLVAGTPTGTFSHAVKALSKQDRLHPRLKDALEQVWAYANQKPGLRHGGIHAPTIDGHEATLAMNVAAATMLHLLQLDSLPPA
jgi:hypothetical protein